MLISSKLGLFTFPDETLQSRAKLVVDTVVGQWFSPKPTERMLITEQDCYDYILHDSSNTLAAVEFKIDIRPESMKKATKSKRKQSALKEALFTERQKLLVSDEALGLV